MKLTAIQRLTLLDYPGHIACTVFTPGCNFRCHYCHNSEFVLPEKLEKIRRDFIPEETFFRFLERRKGKLEGVCVTGGEPTIHKDLPQFIEKIKAMGFLVKLDTNGSNPKMLADILEKKLVDYVAIDVKAGDMKHETQNTKQRIQDLVYGSGFMIHDSSDEQIKEVTSSSYESFCGTSVDMDAIKKSRDLIMDSGVDYEFRTTLVKEFHTDEEYSKILDFVKGAKRYSLQNFRGSAGCLNTKWETYSGFSKDELDNRRKRAEKFVKYSEVIS